ncbi:hypothetical protein SLS62_008156 [Diatrype stigma]|uniref:SH3 domain-containing protein n=1 Tax=Diatrype stigma TaxID=117547 RepID=A0AAN9UM44_9PEZI
MSTRDLGFIEGDLIECLNAGDGSWWTGRLLRNKTVGVFPSNFVEVLPDNFRPVSRSISPLIGSNTPSPSSSVIQKARSKPFRKPFEAYAKAPHYTTAKTPEIIREVPKLRHSRRESPRNVQNLAQESTSRVATPPDTQQLYWKGTFPGTTDAQLRRESSVSCTTDAQLRREGFISRAIAYATNCCLSRTITRSTHSNAAPLRFKSAFPSAFTHARSRVSSTITCTSNTSLFCENTFTRADSGYESHGGDSSQDRQHLTDLQEEPHLPQLTNYVERMESRLRKMHQHSSSMGALDQQVEQDDPPPPPPKGRHQDRPKSSMGDHAGRNRSLRKRRSAYEIGAQLLGRTSTTKTNSTNASSSNQSTTTQSTNKSLMSGTSAGGISATSAGSLARKNQRARSALGFRDGDDELDMNRPITPFSGVSYHPSHSTSAQQRPPSQAGFHDEAIAAIGGLVQPETVKPKKSNFIKRILEATKTGVASGRSSIATGSNNPNTYNRSLQARGHSSSLTAIAGGVSTPTLSAARDMGLNNGVDWVQVRRDVNRSNTLSRKERDERHERCLMMDYPALDPVDELYASVEGDEGADGGPVLEPINYQAINLSQVDKNSRFISNLPPMITSVTLATTYVCRPYRSDVQRLRAIFTWVAEKIHWEEDFEGEVDTRRVIQTKRGCAEEYAVLVHEMCAAIGIHSEVIRGYLKTPGELPESTPGGGGGAMLLMPRPNHWWNAVLVDDAWRLMDCCLASPSNPRRGLYATAASPAAAEPWWFLARPAELCWTHVPAHPAHQHLCPPAAPETLLHLPGACPPYFRHGLGLVDYDTSLTRIEDLEMVHVRFRVPPDVEVAAEVEVRAFARDADGDLFESGDVVRKRALAQAEWCTTTSTNTSGASSEPSSQSGGIVKRYTVKALLPGDEGTGVLKVYAGKRGLMHSIKDIPHPLAFALPIIHTGENPPYEFVTRHPTPHAQRHDIYVVQPQCQRLALNNTFVFAIRQHPALSGAGSSNGSSSMTPSSNPSGGGGGGGGSASPVPPFARPNSAMSMMSSSAAGSSSAGISSIPPSSATGTIAGKKPAKLAIQTPGGKILRLMRKDDQHRRGFLGGGRSNSSSNGGGAGDEDATISSDGGTWETIIKCSERGVWRGLVLADRTARWCVFAEWVCVG